MTPCKPSYCLSILIVTSLDGVPLERKFSWPERPFTTWTTKWIQLVQGSLCVCCPPANWPPAKATTCFYLWFATFTSTLYLCCCVMVPSPLPPSDKASAVHALQPPCSSAYFAWLCSKGSLLIRDRTQATDEEGGGGTVGRVGKSRVTSQLPTPLSHLSEKQTIDCSGSHKL